MAREYELYRDQPSSALRIDYASELNPQQHEAVTAPPGPALVLAGAGTGKTRTLTYRVAWLIENGLPPHRILLLTFTNKAAKEMMSRVGNLLGGDLPQLWGGTFHSIGLRILRLHADRVGYRPDFTVADREDVKDLLGTCIGESGVDVKATRFPKPDALGDLFSTALNTGRSLADVVAQDHSAFIPLTAQLVAIQQRFAERKRRAGLMDFDDLLVLWCRLMAEHDDIRSLYQQRFQAVLVDEYQDTNHLQAALVDLMSGLHRNLTVVGDDAQSIYSWRGADFSNILDFPKRHPGARVFRIETNYRSTPQILDVANAAIAANTRQFKKTLHASRPQGPTPALVPAVTGTEQAIFIAQRVLQLRDEGQPLERIAVLYRSHFHALELQMELTRRNIPFYITSGIRFFEQAHIKDVAAHLKLMVNPLDELAFQRLVKMLPGVGTKGAAKLWDLFRVQVEARLGDLPVVPIAPEPSDNDGQGVPIPPLGPRPSDCLAPALKSMGKAVPSKSAPYWDALAKALSQIAAPEWRDAPARSIGHIIESGYKAYLEASFENSRNRLDELGQLQAYAEQFASTTEFLAQLALQTNLEAEAAAATNADDERLRLSTVHQAKGLEFDTVFVAGASDDQFPSRRSVREGREPEEHRLFYVAASRAKQRLFFTYPVLNNWGREQMR
ncbi:MAG: ATP-dependent helicase, partial [Verrucomicrobiota bacterium]